MLQSLLTGQLKEKPTNRVWCLYSSCVHGQYDCMHYLILQVQQQLEDGDSATAAVAAPGLTTAPAYHHKQFLIIYA
jgi:hypothetical protein